MGKMQVELFLDGNGDGAYDSDIASDTRIRSLQKIVVRFGIVLFQWNELDGFNRNMRNTATMHILWKPGRH